MPPNADYVRAAWKVDFTLPPNEKRSWTKNANATVIAKSLERVVEVIRQSHPDCTLVAIHRVGSEREVIVDGPPPNGRSES